MEDDNKDMIDRKKCGWWDCCGSCDLPLEDLNDAHHMYNEWLDNLQGEYFMGRDPVIFQKYYCKSCHAKGKHISDFKDHISDYLDLLDNIKEQIEAYEKRLTLSLETYN